ncbi:protein VACUOLELESS GAMETOPHYTES-like [Coffea arabica]|uniref:Protein VACUOLELESS GAMETOPHYTES-like n=1 Tax=Coffea arabica TaxID=13443 RepID=A0A6P6TYU1_COFAR|nr:uncharacterized protein LOC113705715 [Coffea arabica]
MEEEGIQHFSHDEHPLIMIELQKNNDNGDGDDKKVEICYGCQKQILEPTAYCCFSCNFFLHKPCAEIPLQITHPMHPQHPLVLHKEPPYSSGSCTCHACGQKGWKFFTYNCSLCKFDLDISCASQDR